MAYVIQADTPQEVVTALRDYFERQKLDKQAELVRLTAQPQSRKGAILAVMTERNTIATVVYMLQHLRVEPKPIGEPAKPSIPPWDRK